MLSKEASEFLFSTVNLRAGLGGLYESLLPIRHRLCKPSLGVLKTLLLGRQDPVKSDISVELVYSTRL